MKKTTIIEQLKKMAVNNANSDDDQDTHGSLNRVLCFDFDDLANTGAGRQACRESLVCEAIQIFEVLSGPFQVPFVMQVELVQRKFKKLKQKKQYLECMDYIRQLQRLQEIIYQVRAEQSGLDFRRLFSIHRGYDDELYNKLLNVQKEDIIKDYFEELER